MRAHITHFGLNYTFWLDLRLGARAACRFRLNHHNPMEHGPHPEGHASHGQTRDHGHAHPRDHGAEARAGGPG